MADPGSEHAVPRLLSEEETRSLIALARSGQAEAAEKLLKHNSRLIKSIVLRFEGRGVEFDDLYQIGSLGMLKAIDRFDPAKGVKFSTYAVTVIMGEIRQYLRDDGLIKTGRNLKELAGKVYRARQEFFERYGKEPTISELEEATKLSREEIAAALEIAQPVSSLQEILHSEDGAAITLEDRVGEEPEEKWMESLSLREALARLEPRLRLIVEERFFREKTQEEIAARIGISQVQVGRLEKTALKLLRELLQEEI
ncbi:MAG: SigB/SigF/SigG family RNA polymerase sigma factor [Firmicutes bacterium]|jgi:RNA polymerase sporulation-specific sigma factor|nr:SigB/SigF/SigG family RNA polymerase sigma factor [Bacillota bacterium]